MEALRIVKQ
ncbi:hypothetical protein PC116_g30000, partial [Phytophthora cactorum]